MTLEVHGLWTNRLFSASKRSLRVVCILPEPVANRLAHPTGGRFDVIIVDRSSDRRIRTGFRA